MRPIGCDRKTRDTVAFRIHALLIGVVISPLRLSSRSVCLTARHNSAGGKAAAGADCRSGSGIAGSSTDGRTQSGTHNGSNRRAAGKILVDDFIRRHLNLLHGPLPADRIIGLE